MTVELMEKIKHLPTEKQQNVLTFWRAQTRLHYVGPNDLQVDNSKRTYGNEIARRLYEHSMGSILCDVPNEQIMYGELHHVKKAFQYKETQAPSKEELKKAQNLFYEAPFGGK